jgi:HK97 family phage portal protein
MRALSWIKDAWRAARPKAASYLYNAPWFSAGMWEGGSRIAVTPANAMQCAAVYTAVKTLAESVAQLPLHLYRRDDKGARDRETDHPLAEILSTAVNEETSSFDFRMRAMEDACLYGNSYAFKHYDARGRIAELWNIPADCVTVEVSREPVGRTVYRVSDGDGAQHSFTRREILHLKTVGSSRRVVAESPVMLNRKAIETTLAMEAHAERLFTRGAKPSGVLSRSSCGRTEVFPDFSIACD